MSGPFEDPDGQYVVLVTGEGARCLWPAWADVPAGWSIAHGPDTRAGCLERVEELQP